MQLLTVPEKEARKVSLAAIRGGDAIRKKLALKYLVLGGDALCSLSTGLFFGGSITTTFEGRASGTPIVPKPPAGLTVADVRPLLADADPETAACAGYLLVLLDESDGMEPLLRQWREHGRGDDRWSRLVYRAIAVANDPRHVPVLREIYGKLQEYDMFRVLLDDPHYERPGDSQVPKTSARRGRRGALAIVQCSVRFHARHENASILSS